MQRQSCALSRVSYQRSKSKGPRKTIIETIDTTLNVHAKTIAKSIADHRRKHLFPSPSASTLPTHIHIHVVVRSTQRLLYQPLRTILRDLIIVHVECLPGFVDVVFFAEDLFDFAEVLGGFAAGELDVVELELLAACEVGGPVRFEAELSDEVGSELIEDFLRFFEGGLGIVAASEEEVSDCA